jgi:hypothetical protein
MRVEIATVWACVLVLVLALATSAGSARADEWDTLRNDERVHNGLLMIAIGRHIELTCPTIERRTIAAGPFLLGLANHAMSLGYSRAEVTEYVEDDTEQERMIAIARQYFDAARRHFAGGCRRRLPGRARRNCRTVADWQAAPGGVEGGSNA